MDILAYRFSNGFILVLLIILFFNFGLPLVTQSASSTLVEAYEKQILNSINGPIETRKASVLKSIELLEIQDNNLELCIKNKALQLAIVGNNFIYSAVELTNLECARMDIVSLVGLEQLTKLTYLNISENNITDISQLAYLKKLNGLDIRDNAVNDISALTELENLKSIQLPKLDKIYCADIERFLTSLDKTINIHVYNLVSCKGRDNTFIIENKKLILPYSSEFANSYKNPSNSSQEYSKGNEIKLLEAKLDAMKSNYNKTYNKK